MRVHHKFTFRENKDERINRFLKENNIKHTVSKGIPLITVEIYEDDQYWFDLSRLFSENNINGLAKCIYSKEEYDTAEWYQIRSDNRKLYPQPENKYKNITYSSEDYCESCGSGLRQDSEFRIKNVPNLNKKHYFSLNWVHDEIFLSERLNKLLEESDLAGFQMKDVLHHKTNNILEGVSQLYVKKYFDKSLQEDRNTFKKIIDCGECNRRKYILSGTSPIYFKGYSKSTDVDICKSKEVFGDGLMSSHLLLISKKFYKLIIDNRVERGLVIEPIYFGD